MSTGEHDANSRLADAPGSLYYHLVLLTPGARSTTNQLMHSLGHVDVLFGGGFKEWPSQTLSECLPLLNGYLTLGIKVALVATDHLKEHTVQLAISINW